MIHDSTILAINICAPENETSIAEECCNKIDCAANTLEKLIHFFTLYEALSVRPSKSKSGKTSILDTVWGGYWG